MSTSIGILHVRRSTFIQASTQRVWQEFETTDRIKAWLDQGHTIHVFEPRIGGRVRMSVEVGGAEHFYGGDVLTVMPGQELSFESQWDGDLAWPVPTFWTIRLSPLYAGTHVELFHHGFERLGAVAAENLQSYEQGWDNKHLIALKQITESEADDS